MFYFPTSIQCHVERKDKSVLGGGILKCKTKARSKTPGPPCLCRCSGVPERIWKREPRGPLCSYTRAQVRLDPSHTTK